MLLWKEDQEMQEILLEQTISVLYCYFATINNQSNTFRLIRYVRSDLKKKKKKKKNNQSINKSH
jgi:hypothetical protein